MPAPPPSAGAIGFMSAAAQDKAQSAADQAARDAQAQSSPNLDPMFANNLAGFVRTEYEMMRIHRQSASGWNNRLLAALRAFNGQYDPQHLAEIQKFKGAEGYLRVIAMKCRGASSLLRDVYLNQDRPWGLEAPGDPDMPVEMIQGVVQKVEVEVQDQSQFGGEPPAPEQIRDRMQQLVAAAKDAVKRRAHERVQVSEDKLDDLLNQGGFYIALSEFLVDLPLFPFACIKGPTVKIYPVVSWVGGKPTTTLKPRLCYDRISPFDIWFTPGVAAIEDAAVIERIRYTRADLDQLLDLPGFNHEAIREVLRVYGSAGFNDDWESTDSTRAVLEHRENPFWNRSKLITGFQYSGNVQGLLLLQQGMDPAKIPDPLRDYAVEVWVIGSYVIKVQMSPSTTRRHSYYISSFEKVPGTPVGNALPDMLNDVQDGINAAWRALLNNMAMASGPQVVVMDDRLAGGETGDDIYPWKRWHTNSDPFAASTTNKPVDFFQPEMHGQELMAIIQFLFGIGDDVSAIPRYLQGNSPGGGAGRTASGLAMLMGNAAKILQTVCANVDRDVIDQVIHRLLDMILLTDTTDLLDGTEKVVVKGVAVAMQRETQRSRQLEFLQITANPIDMGITGIKGRGAVLRQVASDLGMPGEDIVPSEDDLQKQQQQQQQQAAELAAMGGAPPGGGPPGGHGSMSPGGAGGAGPNQPAGPPAGIPGGGAGGGGMPKPVGANTLAAGPRQNDVGKGRQAMPHFGRGGLVPDEIPPLNAAVAPHDRSMTLLAHAILSQGDAIKELAEAQMADTVAVRSTDGKIVGSRKVRKQKAV